jgi:hypothetical protein
MVAGATQTAILFVARCLGGLATTTPVSFFVMSRRLRLLAFVVLVPACAPAATEGWLSLSFTKVNDPRAQIQVLAFFVKPPLGADGEQYERLGCRSEAEERSATIRRLLKVDDGTIAGAGDLTVIPRGGAPRVVRPTGKDKTVYGDLWAPLYSPGQPLDFRFAGADGPSFAGSVIAPSALTMTEPACVLNRPAACPGGDDACGRETVRGTQQRCAPFDRARGLAVRWAPTTHGYVSVRARATVKSPLTPSECTFDARAGFGVIPHAILPAGDVNLEFGSYEAASFVGEKGSLLHVRVRAPGYEWVFADR